MPQEEPRYDVTVTVPAEARDDGGRLISVITRTRNRPDSLREAVASVAAQTHDAVQLVVVNDGGDDVADVLDPFRDRVDITYLTPGRVRRCKAANLALGAARGTWIAWLDDDDLYEPHHLETLVRELRAGPQKVVYTDAHCLRLEKGESGVWNEVERSVPYSQDFSRLLLFRQAYIHLVTVGHHRECFERLGGFDETLEVLEDWDMFFRFTQDYDFRHVPEVTAAFRIRDDMSNAVTALRKEFAETRTRLFQRYVHVAFPELLSELETGRETIVALLGRIDALERRVKELEP